MQQLGVADLLGVKAYADNLGMAGDTDADLLVIGPPSFATGIACHRLQHAPGVLKHGLNTPKAATGKSGEVSLKRHGRQAYKHFDARRQQRTVQGWARAGPQVQHHDGGHSDRKQQRTCLDQQIGFAPGIEQGLCHGVIQVPGLEIPAHCEWKNRRGRFILVGGGRQASKRGSFWLNVGY